MSVTTAVRGRVSSASTRGGWPRMPRLVVLTRSAAPFRAADRSAHSTAWTGAPKSLASARARSGVRLSRRTSGAPASSKATATARAAPPAPSTTAGPASACQPSPLSESAEMNPKPSVLSPDSVPSGSTTTVLTAPIRSAAGDSLSTSATAAFLCGMVRLAPAKPSAGSASSACSRRSGSTGRGT